MVRASGNEDQLRLDIDFESDRAKVTWLPDNVYGVELGPGEPITVMWFIDADVITIPGEQARVSTATARRAVVEYVETGPAANLPQLGAGTPTRCVTSQL